MRSLFIHIADRAPVRPQRRQAFAQSAMSMHGLEPRRLLSAYSLSTVALFGSGSVQTTTTLLANPAGKLFGFADSPGGDGVVYSIAAGGNTIVPTATFDGTDGDIPEVLFRDPLTNNLYGTTNAGGANGTGVVFEIVNGSTTITPLASFAGSGAISGVGDGSVVVDSSGNVFGVSSGSGNSGVVYEVANNSGVVTRVAKFTETSTPGPTNGVLNDPLVIDSSGDLFGTTSTDGGANLQGAIFEIPAGTTTVNTLASFSFTGNQFAFVNNLFVDAGGDIYGSTVGQNSGGINMDGMVFELANKSSSISELASFDENAEGTSSGTWGSGLLADSSGNVFGITSGGTSESDGVVYEVARNSGALTPLTVLNSTTGIATSITMDGSGNLYFAGVQGVFELATPSFATLSNGILTINGTAGNDSITVTDSSGVVTATLNGTPSPTFSGVAGIDVLPAAGDDTVSLAGVPIDATVGGAGGNDSIVGGGGNDSLRGGAGTDTIGGAGGNDSVVGGGGNDFLKGGAGADSILGGPGDDVLHGGTENDTLYGGIGNDTVNGNAGNDSVIAGTGASQLMAGPGSDTITGSITAGDGNDTITLVSDDSVLAGSGDVIIGENSTDTVH